MTDKQFEELVEIISHNIANDIIDMDERQALAPLEVNYLESTDEWVINHHGEVLIDGIVSKKVAENIKDTIEGNALDIVSEYHKGL